MESSREFKDMLEDKIVDFLDFIEEDYLPFLIIGHRDADGLISSSIIAKLLYEKKIPFVFRLLNSLDAKEIKETAFSKIIIADFQVKEEISRLGENKRILVIDHHPPIGDTEKLLVINPYLMGLDGKYDCCCSTLAYILVSHVDDFFIYLAPLAIAGALEDRQDLDERRYFRKINKLVLEEAEEAALISKSMGLVCYSSFSENLAKVFSLMLEPFNMRTFNDHEKSFKFLLECGVSKEILNKRFSELDEKSHSEIFKSLARKMLKEGFDPMIIERIYGYNYVTNAYGKSKNLRQMAKAIDFLARSMNIDTWLLAILEDKLSSFDFSKYFDEYINLIHRILVSAFSEKKYKQYNKFLHFHVEGKYYNFIGSFANLLVASDLKGDVIVFSSETEEGLLKISLRTRKKDIDLGNIAFSIANKLAGNGGGHKDAAGLIIASDKLNDFLSVLDSVL